MREPHPTVLERTSICGSRRSVEKRVDSAQQRYLSAVRTLAQIRKQGCRRCRQITGSSKQTLPAAHNTRCRSRIPCIFERATNPPRAASSIFFGSLPKRADTVGRLGQACRAGSWPIQDDRASSREKSRYSFPSACHGTFALAEDILQQIGKRRVIERHAVPGHPLVVSGGTIVARCTNSHRVWLRGNGKRPPCLAPVHPTTRATFLCGACVASTLQAPLTGCTTPYPTAWRSTLQRNVEVRLDGYATCEIEGVSTGDPVFREHLCQRLPVAADRF
jgi:hypothetical protein